MNKRQRVGLGTMLSAIFFVMTIASADAMQEVPVLLRGAVCGAILLGYFLLTSDTREVTK
jgi:predicted branched-subunit amino acid permease